MKKFLLFLLFVICAVNFCSAKILIYMDAVQNDHLKAYGLVHWVLKQNLNVQWLLNFRGGSFLCDSMIPIKNKAIAMGVSFDEVSSSDVADIFKVVDENNMDTVLLEKAPKIAIYKPPDTDPWDDAVNMALVYAEIPFDKIWDKAVLGGELHKYDWLHLHHEDFSGQYGKFYASFRNSTWYKERVARYENLAHSLGFKKVSQLKLAVSKEIKTFVKKGGFLFAMCSATDSFDIALAAEGLDIIESPIDGDGMTSDCQNKLDYNKSFFFTDYKLITSPYIYEFSNIDVDAHQFNEITRPGDFVLFDFAAKFDRPPTILTQNHVRLIPGFLGQTTAFKSQILKKDVIVMGKIDQSMAKYVYTTYGEGTAVFFAGHDPEDFAHLVGEEPTNLILHKNSPGYRLILNNTLYPAARVKKRKT